MGGGGGEEEEEELFLGGDWDSILCESFSPKECKTFHSKWGDFVPAKIIYSSIIETNANFAKFEKIVLKFLTGFFQASLLSKVVFCLEAGPSMMKEEFVCLCITTCWS